MQLLSTSWVPVVVAFVAGGISLMIFRRAWSAVRRGASERAVAARAAWFHERVVDFRNQATTLDQHSNEYVAVFNDDHWSSLMKMLTQLETVDQQIQRLLAAGKRDDALTLLNYICDSRRNSSMDKVAEGLEEVAELINWEQVVHAMLRRVISNLETATITTGRLVNPHNSRRKQPTLVTLADIKKKLLEDEAFQGES